VLLAIWLTSTKFEIIRLKPAIFNTLLSQIYIRLYQKWEKTFLSVNTNFLRSLFTEKTNAEKYKALSLILLHLRGI
jgi:hypothetical protein